MTKRLAGTIIPVTMTGAGSQPTGGELNSAIADAIVRILRRHVGRGPAKAQAFFRQNVVVVLLEDAATTAERRLIAGGDTKTALHMRRELQDVMRDDMVETLEQLTGCRVMAFMSDNHFDPDMGVELFVLDRWVGQDQKNMNAETTMRNAAEDLL